MSFFSFAALDQPVLRSLYVAITSVQEAMSSHLDFLLHAQTST